nr:putative cellulase [uncultured bacterium]
MIHRKIQIVFLLTTVLCTLFLGLSNNAFGYEVKSKMQSYVDNLHPGWNLGNTFDATGSETSWGNPKTTKELIDAIAAQGFRSIRIPVTWGHRMGSAPDYTIKPEFLERVASIVDWSLDNDLYVMLNMHHDTSWIYYMDSKYDEVLAQYKAAWVQISNHFKDYPLEVMFESLNEPRFDDDWGRDTPRYFEMLDTLNMEFYDIVRNSGGNNGERPLVFSTMTASVTQKRLDELAKTMNKFNDDRLIATIHYYGYYPFSVNVAGDTKFSSTAKVDLTATLDRAYNTFVKNGVPVIIGEFGLLGFDKDLGTIQQGEKLKFFEYMTYYAQERDLALMLWDNGQHYQRRLNKWSDEALYSTIMVPKGQRSSYTEDNFIFLKKGAPIKDKPFKLELNGNDLVKITHGEYELQKGTEYDILYGRLVIKSEFLEKLNRDEFGEVATVTCHFSAGVPWDISVYSYDTPVFEEIETTRNRFRIPVEFKGDLLATMEALYVKGGNAGPNNWTSYKQFGADFDPQYERGYIEILPEFFGEVKDQEPIRLKFHFWSGEVVEYTITKDGVKVTGMP